MVDGVMENVIDIMLNFKKLRFKFDEQLESIQWVSQRFSGVGKYDSSAIKLPAGVELLSE
ncbi:hypothetical protein KKG31_07535 [Patescibacteria group bacterium]|nr:hypothetical protein [Patescibacteria group bacterium]MBU1758920.1 hypothetical protein [Patescibacteria group bacterium]